MKGLFPSDKKKIPVRLLGCILAGTIAVGFGGCAAAKYVTSWLPFTKPAVEEVTDEQVQAIAEKYRMLVQSQGAHDQALITVVYDNNINKCVIIWE